MKLFGRIVKPDNTTGVRYSVSNALALHAHQVRP